ncbi:MAG: hypothetical protein GWN18_19420, partial [Thermoplasmata archaeon]|nr:hypothetical protein [Thermoplasmata archaeon]NIS14319.1 hypothetical protein [Thermoplasmata archaeon]NIS22141.1 hypothetical protein [Thermoplasmata archaeon]NIT80023.1 hypothetical protein [Thermoplasmata archaeon]NIU51157.1 hypothetical protein [Thermoplasmata archaeon]
WDEEEDKRDKGDNCIALTHQGEHTVCLVLSGDNVDIPHIATIAPGEDVVRTYLHCTYHNQPGNLVEAAVMLGGPKVRAALSLGKKVVTDWVGRRTFIHHEGQDHVHPHVEELPWQAATIKTTPGRWGDEIEVIPATVHGDSVEVVGE